MVESLNKYMNGSQSGLSQSDKDNFLSTLFVNGNSATPSYETYGIPFMINTKVLFYNKTIFEKYGWSVPKTFDDVRKLTDLYHQTSEYQQLTDKNKVATISFDNTTDLFLEALEQGGSDSLLLLADESSVEEVWYNNRAKEIVSMLNKDLLNGTLATAEKYDMNYVFDAFKASKTLMYVGVSNGYKYAMPIDDSFEVGIAEVPSFFEEENKKSLVSGTDLYLINQGTELEKYCSWLFMKYLLSYEGNLALTTGESGNFYPLRKDVINSSEYTEKALNLSSNLKQIIELRKNETPTFALPTKANLYDKVRYIGDSIIHRVFYAQQTVDEAFDALRYLNWPIEEPEEPKNPVYSSIKEAKDAAYKKIYEENQLSKQLVTSAVYTLPVGVYGVVTAVMNKENAGQFMIHDGTDGIYVYSNSVEVKPGDQVLVYGDIYAYYGTLQIGSNITIEKLSNGSAVIGQYEETTPQALHNDKLLKDTDGNFVNIGFLSGDLVNVAGKLVKGAALKGSGMYRIDDVVTGEQTWIYYKSYNPEMQATLDSYDGQYVKVRGVTYDVDNRIMKCEIIWDGIISTYEPNLTDEQRVQETIAKLSVPSEAESDFDLSSLATWEVISGTAIVVENGVAKVTRGESLNKVILKATVTIGTVSDAKEFEINVPATKKIITIAEALALCPTEGSTVTEEKYYIRGTITEVQNTTYGNLIITDTTGSILIYGSYSADGKLRYDKLEVKPVIGDVVTVYGALRSYNNGENILKEVKNGWIQEHFVTKNYTDAVTLAGTTNDVYTEAKYLLGGTVVSIENTKYGNLTIADAEGTKFTVYGSFSEDGKVRYDVLENKPAVGDYVYCYGILGYYNAPQMKDASLIGVN